MNKYSWLAACSALAVAVAAPAAAVPGRIQEPLAHDEAVAAVRHALLGEALRSGANTEDPAIQLAQWGNWPNWGNWNNWNNWKNWGNWGNWGNY